MELTKPSKPADPRPFGAQQSALRASRSAFYTVSVNMSQDEFLVFITFLMCLGLISLNSGCQCLLSRTQSPAALRCTSTSIGSEVLERQTSQDCFYMFYKPRVEDLMEDVHLL